MEFNLTIPTIKKSSELESMISEIEKNSRSVNKIIVSCQEISAAKNRNLCLDLVESEIFIMIDDDISGFFPGWDIELTKLLLEREEVIAVTARAMKPDGTYGLMCGVDMDLENRKDDYGIVPKRIDVIMPSMALAVRRSDLRFDENYRGSGWEDTDYLFQHFYRDLSVKFAIMNKCKLIHAREMKHQKEYFQFNRDYFYKKWGMEDYPLKPKE